MMGQNTSSAVMQQRRADGADRRSGRDVGPQALEYFPTPPWAKRLSGDEIAARRDLTDQARTAKRPGETLHDAIKRLSQGGQP